MTIEADIGVMYPQAKNAWSHQKLEEARKECLLELPGEQGGQISEFWPPQL